MLARNVLADAWRAWPWETAATAARWATNSSGVSPLGEVGRGDAMPGAQARVREGCLACVGPRWVGGWGG